MIGIMIIVTLVSMLLMYYIAGQRGANQKFWVVMAFLFGPLALPFVFFSKNAEEDNNGSREM